MHAPMDDLGSSLPVTASLEAGVARHELCQERVELVLGAKLEAERVEECDEVLQGALSAHRLSAEL